MEKLTRKLLDSDFNFNKDISIGIKEKSPERVLQFGEGNFLRGFVDYMIDKLNKNGLFNGSVVVVQPIANGMCNMLDEQDGLYTLYLRGLENGNEVCEKSLITAISRTINPYVDFNAYVECAKNPELRVIVSNTTEAGISFDETDKITDTPPKSFPAKLSVLLYERFKHFNGDAQKGFIIIPCELIDYNGTELKRVVKLYSKLWDLGDEFDKWLDESNYFTNTLVDRIVTGYPRDEIQAITEELGYVDNLVNTAEIFHFWVIEGDKKLAKELQFTEIGLDVVWTDDATPYKMRKVRILNGAHTMTVLAAYLVGKDTVGECMNSDMFVKYLNKGLFDEIIPTLDLPNEELVSFANAVFDRFANPYIKHYLLSISLNSVSKFKARVLPSILEYIKRKNELPKVLTFSFAALIAFYKGTQIEENALIGNRGANEYKICDNIDVIEEFAKLWQSYGENRINLNALVEMLCAKAEWWGSNLNEFEGFAQATTKYLSDILDNGAALAIENLLEI